MAMEIWVELSVVIVLPNASRMRTVTAGLIASPAVALVGCCTKATLFAAPGFTVTTGLPAVSVVIVPVLLRDWAVKVTLPAVWVAVTAVPPPA